MYTDILPFEYQDNVYMGVIGLHALIELGILLGLSDALE